MSKTRNMHQIITGSQQVDGAGVHLVRVLGPATTTPTPEGERAMRKKDHIILAIHIHNRAEQALQVQKTLGESGNIIRTRLGLHELDDKVSAAAGVVLLEVVGTAAEADELVKKLRKCRGVQVKKLVFPHK